MTYKTLAFLGDSITAAADWDLILTTAAQNRDPNAPARTGSQNYGVSGDTTAQMLARVSSVYTNNPKPDICFILGGRNDATLGAFDASQTGHNLIDICGDLRNNGVMPVLIYTFRVGTAESNYVNLNSEIDAIRAYLSSYDYGAISNMVDCMDLNKIWMAPSGVLTASYTTDGTHLTASGYAEWAFLLDYWLNEHGY